MLNSESQEFLPSLAQKKRSSGDGGDSCVRWIFVVHAEEQETALVLVGVVPQQIPIEINARSGPTGFGVPPSGKLT